MEVVEEFEIAMYQVLEYLESFIRPDFCITDIIAVLHDGWRCCPIVCDFSLQWDVLRGAHEMAYFARPFNQSGQQRFQVTIVRSILLCLFYYMFFNFRGSYTDTQMVRKATACIYNCLLPSVLIRCLHCVNFDK